MDNTTIAWLLGYLNADQQDAVLVGATAAIVVGLLISMAISLGKGLGYIEDGRAGEWSLWLNTGLSFFVMIATILDPGMDVTALSGMVTVLGSAILQLAITLGSTKAAYIFLRWIGVAYSHPNGLPVTGPMPTLPPRPSNGNQDAL